MSECFYVKYSQIRTKNLPPAFIYRHTIYRPFVYPAKSIGHKTSQLGFWDCFFNVFGVLLNSATLSAAALTRKSIKSEYWAKTKCAVRCLRSPTVAIPGDDSEDFAKLYPKWKQAFRESFSEVIQNISQESFFATALKPTHLHDLKSHCLTNHVRGDMLAAVNVQTSRTCISSKAFAVRPI